MGIIRSVSCLTWILMNVFTFGQSLLHINKQTNSSNKPADMISMLESAISGNAAVYDPSLHLNKGAVVKLPMGKPLLNMTRSTWSLPTISTGTNTEHVLDSVPLPGTSSAVLVSTNKGKSLNETGSALFGNTFVESEANKVNTNHSLVRSKIGKNSTKLAQKMSGSNKAIGKKSDTLKSGLYIPLEKLSRLKRQINNVSTSGTAKSHARVLLLMNGNKGRNISNAQDKFLGKVLMLVKQPNVSTGQLNYSSLHHPVINVESRNSLQELLNPEEINAVRMGDTLREVTQSQPAIQRINDLNKIALPLTPLEFTTENTSMNSTKHLNNQQLKNLSHSQNFTFKDSIGQTPSLLDVPLQENHLQLNSRRNNTQQGMDNLIGRQQDKQSNLRTVDLHNSNRQTAQRFANRQTGSQSNNNQQSSRSLSVRGPSVTRSSKQLIINQPRRVVSQQGTRTLVRLPVERQLTIQQPVSSNRVTVHSSRRSRPRTSITGSRLNRPLVRAISSRDLNQQRPGRRTVAPRITQTQRRRRMQHRRPSTRRQVIRRRPAPPDPFTRRFSAGFQRGSNLLHQPPLDLTSFGNTPGFNTLTPVETRLPPFSPPRLFGGIPLPGLFPGPTII